MRTLGILLFIVVLGFVFLVPARSQGKNEEREPVVTYTVVDEGIFNYKSDGYDGRTGKTTPIASVMHANPSGGSSGAVFGFITPTTTISYLDPDLRGLTRKSLSLLHGKEVMVIARIRHIGIGEGGECYFERLEILLAPDLRE